MFPFDYRVATDRGDALELARGERTVFVAGGTSIVDLMKLGVETPSALVDINGLGLDRIEGVLGGVRIGALAKNSDVAYHPLIATDYPMLSQALLAGASPQVRNMASVSGNLLQRTRCPYFRETSMPCNKRTPNSGCAAMDGHNRSHAILGVSEHCIATHPSDMCVALVALDAMIHVDGREREREIRMLGFHRVPGARPDVETELRPGELITHVFLPSLSFAKRSAYVKVRDRASFAFALASAAVALDVRGGIIEDARVALGGVATVPWRSAEAERELIGRRAVAATYRAAAEAAVSGARPRRDNHFKIELVKRTLERALASVGGLP